MKESNIIDLSKRREKENEPDVSCVSHDASGKPLYKYSYSYQHNGRTLTMDFTAYDYEDAKSLCQNIKETLTLDGQVVSEGYV